MAKKKTKKPAKKAAKKSAKKVSKKLSSAKAAAGKKKAAAQPAKRTTSINAYLTFSGNCEEAFRSTFKALVILGSGPVLCIFVFAPDLCARIFGEPWREAGEFARILAPLYFFNFVASPLSYVFFVAGKQRLELNWQIALFATTFAVFLSPTSLKQTLINYTISYSALYVLYLYLSYRSAKNSRSPSDGRSTS